MGPPGAWPAALTTLVSIMLTSNTPMFIAWGPSRCLLYNDAYGDILGTKHPRAFGSDFLDVWHEIRQELEPIVEAAYRGEPVQMDNIQLWMHRRGFREETHFSFFYAPVHLEHGGVAGFFCACTETTGQVLAERRLAESEARHRSVLANMDEGFALFDADFTFLEINDETARMVGMTRAQMMGQRHWDLFPGSADTELGQRYRLAMAERRITLFEYQHVYPDGRKPWYEIRVYPVGDGLAILFRDITQRLELQRDAELVTAQMALALDVAQIGTWQWDIPQGTVTADLRCRQICGLPLDKQPMPVADFHQHIHPQDWPRVESAFLKALGPDAGTGFAQEFRWVHPDATVAWTAVRALVQLEGVGPTPHAGKMSGTVIDITERKQMVEALQDADLRKDEFLAMLAHELRNPLAPIATAAHLLANGGAQSSFARQASQVIHRQVGHLSRLIDDLLDISRVTRGLVQLERKPVDLRDVLSAAAEQVRGLVQARGHELRLSVEAGHYSINADFHRLVQVLSNLLNNAAKYTPPGGQIEVRLRSENTTLALEVSDTGSGIPADLLPHVFDLFTQGERKPHRDQGGLGIGLALVKKIVELHDGTVSAHSPGTDFGSTFIVRLPFTQVQLRQPATAVPVSQPARASRRVLVVDDNVDAADTLAEWLSLMGYEVTTAYDGQTALALVADDQPWDTFILDIGLPDMTGYELAEKMRGLLPSLPLLVALTGYGQAQDRADSRNAGFDHHLVKPADMTKLLSLIQQA